MNGQASLLAVLPPWDRVKHLLPLDEMGGESLVVERVMSGEAHLWPGKNSIGVTEVTDAGRLRVWGAGGSMFELLDMLPCVEAFARALGCPAVEVLGRKGWRRVLSNFGFRHECDDIVVKEV